MSSPRPTIERPQAVPVVGRDEHLPRLSAEHLAPAALRQAFLQPGQHPPEFSGDGGTLAGREPRAAAVLVPLVVRDEGLTVLLTRRTDHLHDHAGQISFPGGRHDEGDADAEATALREAQEEVGLAAQHVELIGRLPVYTTVTHYAVTPVVGLVRPGFTLQLDRFEVAEAFEVPLSFLMNPGHHQRHRFEWEGHARHFLSMPWHEAGREYFIWGATAAMLRNLYRFLVQKAPAA